MIIDRLIEVRFLERPNRFTVIFEYISTENEVLNDLAHLRDPGRLNELLVPGVRLLLRKATNLSYRKTNFDVIAAFKKNCWVLINSGFHSELATEIIKKGLVDELRDYIIEKREYTFGKSRLDFLLSIQNDKRHLGNEKMLLEVKGCTLVESNVAKFPDAPTLRGKKHLEELIEGKKQGFEASVLFLVLKEDAEVFSPNIKTDLSFSKTLEIAYQSGVHIIPFVFKTTLKDDFLIIEPYKRINSVLKP